MKKEWPAYVVSRIVDKLLAEFPDLTRLELATAVRECLAERPSAADQNELVECCREYLLAHTKHGK